MAAFGLPGFGFGDTHPQDPMAAQAAIARKQKLLDAMQASTLNSPLVGNQGGMQAIAKLVGLLAGQNRQGKLEESRQRADMDYGKALGVEAQSYLDRRQGKPEVPGTTPMADPSMGDAGASGMSGGTPAVPANPRGAIIQAMTSRFPELQKVGGADFLQYGKSENNETFGQPVTERGPEGKLISVQYGNRGGRRPVQGATPFERPMTVADRVIDPANPQNPLANFETTGGETRVINGDLYQLDSNKKWRKLDNAPNVKVSVGGPVIAGQKQGFQEWSRLAAQTVSEMATSARNSVKSLSALGNLEVLSAGGVNGGPTADIAAFLQGLAKTGGIQIDEAQLANSQAFGSVATQLWANLMQQNGGARGLVKEESEKLAQSLPSLIQTPQGRRQIIATLRQVAHQNIAEAKKAQAEYAKALTAQDASGFTFGLSSAELPVTQPMSPPPGGASMGGGPVVKNW